MDANTEGSPCRAQKAIRRRGNSRCPQHQGQNVVFKCIDCSKLACMKCASSLHRGHTLDEICDIMPDVKQKLKQFIAATERDEIPRMKGKLKNVDDELLKNRQYYQNLISEIEEQHKVLKAELDSMAKELVKTCRNMEQTREDIFHKYKNDLQTVIDDLTSRVNECKAALQSANDIQAYDIGNDIPAAYKEITPKESSTAKFIPGILELGNLRSLLGALVVSEPEQLLLKEPPSPTTTGWDVTSHFTPSVGCFVKSMHAVADNQVWVCLYNLSNKKVNNQLLLLDNKGRLQQTLDLNVSVFDFCPHPTSGNIWFVSCDDHLVREVKFRKQRFVLKDPKPKKFTSDGASLSMCISKENTIYIGKAGCIIKYTLKGEVLCEAKGDDSPIVRSPRRMTLCPVSGNLAVSDFNENKDGGQDEPRVIILSKGLQTLYQYYGHRHGHQSPEIPFNPCDVCYNANGQIVISDCYNRSILVVNQKGEFLQTLYTNSESCTEAVCIQSNGVAFVSFGDGSVVVLKEQ